jgi:hypothetical protein
MQAVELMFADNLRELMDLVCVWFQPTVHITPQRLSRGSCLRYCSCISGYEDKVSAVFF